MRASARRTVLALALGSLVLGCTSVVVPPRSVEVRPFAGARLEGARSVWIEGAVCRSGGAASGLAQLRRADGAHRAGGGVRSAREEVAAAVRRVRRLELAPAREAADLVLYFEQADRLRCFFCRQPEDRWYWWGLVLDPAGNELASLHGETRRSSPRAPARRFVEAVAELARRGREAVER